MLDGSVALASGGAQQRRPWWQGLADVWHFLTGSGETGTRRPAGAAPPASTAEDEIVVTAIDKYRQRALCASAARRLPLASHAL